MAVKKDIPALDLKPLSERLKLHPRIVEALITSAIMSDHEGIQQQLDDLLVIVKMTHPERAHVVSEIMKEEEKARLAEIQYEKEQHERHKQIAIRQKQKEADRRALIAKIKTSNLNVAQKQVDGLRDKIGQGYSFDKLGYQEQGLTCQIMTHCPGYVERCGFLWCNVRWIGNGDVKLNTNHPIYLYLKQHRWDLFQEVPEMKLKSHGFYSVYDLEEDDYR